MSSPNRDNLIKGMRLETSRLLIRPYVESDLIESFQLMQNKELFKYLKMEVMSFESYQKLFNWLIKSYDKGLDEHFQYSFVIDLKETRKFIGWCGVGGLEYNHAVKEIYYLIGRDYWNNGYASEAVDALINFCFNTLNLDQLAAKVNRDNIASKKIIENAGFNFQFNISGLPENFSHINGELFHTLSKDEYLAKRNHIGESLNIVDLRERMDLYDKAVRMFWEQWGTQNNFHFYRDCILQSCNTDSDLPRFYIAIQDNSIVGTYALLRNDLISRQDLYPWLACLYVVPEFRGKRYGMKLLDHAVEETLKKGYEKLYLCTSLDGYYEKLDWTFLTEGYLFDGQSVKIYEKRTE